MKNKILLIIAYFGEFHNYFDLLILTYQHKYYFDQQLDN